LTQLAHKIRLYPNNRQATYFKQACGVRRFSYNWALAESLRLHNEGEKTSGYDLCKRLNAVKHDQFPWMTDVTKWAPQKGVYDAWDALISWWKGRTRRPRFHKKGKQRDRFYLGINAFSVKGRKIRIPKIGYVKMAQELRFPGKLKHAVVSRDGDHWYASVSVEIDDTWNYKHQCKSEGAVGIDVGIKSLAVISNEGGTQTVHNPRFFVSRQRKLRRLQKALSRKKKGSNRRAKAKLAVTVAYRKIRNTRSDFIHKLTSVVVRENRFIGIEDLNVKGMVKNRKLAKHVSDASFGEIRRQLTYKASLAGAEVVLADRFFPSSKLCSTCGYKLDELSLGTREWRCPQCKSLHDRDVNAAMNLRNVARRYRETQNARGDCVTPETILATVNETRIEHPLTNPVAV